jgi:hypothetical protein
MSICLLNSDSHHLSYNINEIESVGRGVLVDKASYELLRNRIALRPRDPPQTYIQKETV